MGRSAAVAAAAGRKAPPTGPSRNWLARRPVGGEVSAHVKKYLDSEKFESRAGELGQDVVQTVDREIDQHLHQVFDHSVSRLAAVPGEAAAAPAVEPSGAYGGLPAESSEELFPHRDRSCGPASSAEPRATGDRAQRDVSPAGRAVGIGVSCSLSVVPRPLPVVSNRRPATDN